MDKRDRIYTLEKENEEISLKIYRLLEKLTDTEIIESNANDGMSKKVRELFDL